VTPLRHALRLWSTELTTNPDLKSYKLTHHLLAALLGVALTTTLHAQSSASTYQGQLTDNGSPANGTYDLLFQVCNAATFGTQRGPEILKAGHRSFKGWRKETRL